MQGQFCLLRMEVALKSCLCVALGAPVTLRSQPDAVHST